ncbi:MAG TPA: hypothetical protein VE197_08960, partial [Mycobacterium sp.]|nr:hypothetical protein [Mycobacterium sp.]
LEGAAKPVGSDAEGVIQLQDQQHKRRPTGISACTAAVTIETEIATMVVVEQITTMAAIVAT